MKGENKIELNEQTVIAALQLYFDTKIYRDDASPKITAIEVDGNKGYGSGLIFKLKLLSEEPATPTAAA